MENTELMASANYRLATDVAGLCRDIVMKSAITIQGKRYVPANAWEAIAAAHGCVASSRDVTRIESGFKAIGEIRRIDNGIVIATAEGFVGDDEKTWSSRPEYARRAMAQTRAVARAAKQAFAHVVVLIDSNLSTTPAEEVPSEGFHDASNPSQVAPAKAKSTKTIPIPQNGHQNAPQAQPGAKSDEPSEDWRNVKIHFGKNKGIRLEDLESRSLSWYSHDWLENKEAEENAGKKIHPNDLFLVRALQARRREKQEQGIIPPDSIPKSQPPEYAEDDIQF